MVKEFFEFLKKYGVVSLALAVMLGGKVNDLVSSLVNDLVLPILFQPLLRSMGLEDIRALAFHGIFYGKFVGALLDFVLMAAIVFFVAKFIFKEEVVSKK